MKSRTSWHHDISQAHGGFDVLLKRRLNELVVLLDDPFNVSSPLRNVPPQPTHQPDVRVRVHENLHVQQLTGAHDGETKRSRTRSLTMA